MSVDYERRSGQNIQEILPPQKKRKRGKLPREIRISNYCGNVGFLYDIPLKRGRYIQFLCRL